MITNFNIRLREDEELRSIVSCGTVTVASIDPGLLNFCIRIEKRYINNHGLRIDTVRMNVYNLVELYNNTYSARKNGKTMLPIDIYTAASHVLSESITDRCDIILVEGQLIAKNHKMGRLCQHILTYCSCNYKSSLVYEVSPRLKTSILKKALHSDIKNNKIWSVHVAKDLLSARNDQVGLSIITSGKKRDDMADVIVMIEAFFISKKVRSLITDMNY